MPLSRSRDLLKGNVWHLLTVLYIGGYPPECSNPRCDASAVVTLVHLYNSEVLGMELCWTCCRHAGAEGGLALPVALPLRQLPSAQDQNA